VLGLECEIVESDDATVVVGYVIDPEMTDQIRVTVVATGIGRPMAARGLPPGTQPAVQVVAGGRAARRPLENYADLEIPTHVRRRRAVGDDVRMDSDESYLDIPAFLRRQAD
jgi:cell division protein FtsZ